MVCDIAGKIIRKKHDLSKPQGVRGRNSDNTLLIEKLGWSPTYPIEKGMFKTYYWIASQISAHNPKTP